MTGYLIYVLTARSINRTWTIALTSGLVETNGGVGATPLFVDPFNLITTNTLAVPTHRMIYNADLSYNLHISKLNIQH